MPNHKSDLPPGTVEIDSTPEERFNKAMEVGLRYKRERDEVRQQLAAMTEARNLCKRQTAEVSDLLMTEKREFALAVAQLRECEEALRSEREQHEAFREQMLEPIKGTEGKSIESMPWDDLLGVAVRNLNATLEAHDALTELMSEARAYLEPSGSYANRAMAKARAALGTR